MQSSDRTYHDSFATNVPRVNLVGALSFLFWYLIPLGASVKNEQSVSPKHSDFLDSLAHHTSLSEREHGLQYEAIFAGLGRDVIGRANSGMTGLQNNIPNNLNLVPGSTAFYVFSNGSQRATGRESVLKSLTGEEEVSRNDQRGALRYLERRQELNGRAVFITVNTCLQPSFSNLDNETNPPQLSLYVSITDENQQPGPDSRGDQYVTGLFEGYGNMSVNASGNVYVGVSAPPASVLAPTVWNFEIAASVDQPYHQYNDTAPQLKLLDSDANAALLVTTGLVNATPSTMNTSDWLRHGPPFSVFILNDNDTTTLGMRHSYCGLRQKSLISAMNIAPMDNGAQTLITTKQPGPEPEQEIYVPRLNVSSTYLGFLVEAGNTTNQGAGIPGGGGTVYDMMNFTTKRDGNCAVIYNLSFCSTVAYAVPANPNTYPNLANLTALYDNNASALYANFSYSLQQIACNTTATAQYSLVKTCDDCATAYKTWLCAVTIPRCADYSPAPIEQETPSAYDFLMPRNVAQDPFPGSGVAKVTNHTLLDWLATNSSRNNATIAGMIQPGPYRELLPCEDLCFDLVRSCPAALGFGCPTRGKGLEAGYGVPGQAIDGSPKCSIPGAVYRQSNGSTIQIRTLLRWTCLALCLFCASSV